MCCVLFRYWRDQISYKYLFCKPMLEITEWCSFKLRRWNWWQPSDCIFQQEIVTKGTLFHCWERVLCNQVSYPCFLHLFIVFLIVIQTDLWTLEWLEQLKENNTQLTWWSLSLQPYDFIVKDHSGSKNGNAVI